MFVCPANLSRVFPSNASALEHLRHSGRVHHAEVAVAVVEDDIRAPNARKRPQTLGPGRQFSLCVEILETLGSTAVAFVPVLAIAAMEADVSLGASDLENRLHSPRRRVDGNEGQPVAAEKKNGLVAAGAFEP